MAVFVWSELIDRARVYIDDDHNETEGFISPTQWLNWGFVEYAQLYKKWIRMGLVKIECINTTFTSPGVSIPDGSEPEGTGVLAVVGVAEDLGNYRYRILPELQSAFGRDAFLPETATPKAYGWIVEGDGDDLRVWLEPRFTQSGNYVVRWIQTPVRPQSTGASVDLPFGADERLVLGMAKRAMVKDLTSSNALRELIAEADAELAFSAAGKLPFDSPRVRKVRPSIQRNLSPTGFPTDPTLYRYL